MKRRALPLYMHIGHAMLRCSLIHQDPHLRFVSIFALGRASAAYPPKEPPLPLIPRPYYLQGVR